MKKRALVTLNVGNQEAGLPSRALRQLRVCILQDRLRNGGTERNSLWLANALNDATVNTHLVLFTHPATCPNPAVPQWSALRRGSGKFIPDFYAPGLIQTLRRIQPDVLLCMGRNANCHGVRIKKHLANVRLFTSYRTNRRLPRLYRKSIAISDGCITNSRWAQQQLLEHLCLLPAERIHVIQNPLMRDGLLTLERGAEAKTSARNRLGIPADALVCINCAHFVRGKNQAAMLTWLQASVQKRPGLLLLLLGDGPARKRCQALAKKLQVSANVRFCGQVETLESHLQASDLYISTSLREGSPNALVEAQAAGLPVIAYDTAGSCETFIDEQSGHRVPVNNPNALAAAIESLLADATKRQAFANCARKFAALHFAPALICQQYRKAIF